MRTKLLGALACALVGGFLFVMMRIATLPLEMGDAYPAYSSMRADPRGTKALYESLRGLPELQVSRSFQPLQKLKGTQGTIFLLGEDARRAGNWSEDELKLYESLANAGARVIIAFRPEPPAVEEKADKVPEKHETFIPPFEKRWNVSIEAYEATVDEAEAAGSMPRDTSLYFELGAGSGWSVIDVNSEEDATLIAHEFGKGQILLLTDSYPLSNEGLRADRDLALIELLAGTSRQLVFDESHLGVEDSASIGTLIRRYRLTAAFAVGLLLALLFLWKNSTSLLPRAAGEPDVATAMGADARSGLVNLLKRSVQPGQLPRACWTRWKDTRALGRPVPSARVTLAETALTGGGSPVAVYQRIQQILTEKQ